MQPFMVRYVWLFILGCWVAPLQARVWTDRQGKKVEADYLGMEAGTVFLKLTENGQTIRIPAAQLSPTDVTFVKRLLAEGKSNQLLEGITKFNENPDAGLPPAPVQPVRAHRGGKTFDNVASEFYPKSQDFIKHTIKEIEDRRGAESSIQGAVNRLNIFRFLSDVAFDVELDEEYNAYAAAAADICRRLGHLDHNPENPGMEAEDYERARIGAGRSNLFAGGGAPSSVFGYMNDSDPGNIAQVGHRRWCLNPGMAFTGFGESGNYAAMYSFDNRRKEVPPYDFVCFPAVGYMPVEYFQPGYAFSISFNPEKWDSVADIAPEQVHVYKLKESGDPDPYARTKELPLDFFNASTAGYGIPNCLIFRAENIEVERGNRYWVEIQDLRSKGGKTRNFGYLVEFMRL